MDVWIEGGIGRWREGWVNEWMFGWVVGQMDRWMEGFFSSWNIRCMRDYIGNKLGNEVLSVVIQDFKGFVKDIGIYYI